MRLKPHEKVPKFGSEKLILAEHIDNYFCLLDVLGNFINLTSSIRSM